MKSNEKLTTHIKTTEMSFDQDARTVSTGTKLLSKD